MSGARRVIVGLILLQAFFGGPSRAEPADDFRRAIQAAGKGDYPATINILKPMVEAGDGRAAYYLATLYNGGYGYKPPDPSQALRWHIRAAELGLAEAQATLGDKYYDGLGVKQDLAEAAKWYRLSAAQGFASSQGVLGEMYETGRGVSEDKAEALRLYLLSAAQGRAVDQINAGRLYATGAGTAKDEAMAVKYFRLAAHQRHPAAALWLSSAYETGSGVVRDLTVAYMWSVLAQKFANIRNFGPSLPTGLDVVTDNLRREMSPQAVELAQQMAANWQPGDPRN